MIIILILIICLNILIIIVTPSYITARQLKPINLSLNISIFNFSLLIWFFFDNSTINYQFLFNISWFEKVNLLYLFGIDGFSLPLIILTTFLFPFYFITMINERNLNYRIQLIYFLLIELFIIITFTSLDLFLFFIFFESTLIPMFLLVGTWGSQLRKIKAAYLFFLFTFIGSLFILFNLFYLFSQYGTLNYYNLLNSQISFHSQIIIWCCFFLPFSIKTPLFPFHIWLPETHVEAPTSGSMLLAGLLLKLGTYGFLRFLVPLCPDANLYFQPFSFTLLCVGLIFTSLITIIQTDLKRIIAYSSITHMTFTVLGILTFNFQTLQGSMVLMLAHGLTSISLFYLVGILYKRTHTRLLIYYGGVAQLMPVYSIFIFIFCLANFGMPLTFNFIGEFLIFCGLIQNNLFLALLVSSGLFCSLIYSMYFINRLLFGNLKLNYIKSYSDLTRLEVYTLLPLLIYIIILGCYPNSILQLLNSTIKLYLI
jgi:proton-translocating NADH-quinone oxidoreductase chain M